MVTHDKRTGSPIWATRGWVMVDAVTGDAQGSADIKYTDIGPEGYQRRRTDRGQHLERPVLVCVGDRTATSWARSWSVFVDLTETGGG